MSSNHEGSAINISPAPTFADRLRYFFGKRAELIIRLCLLLIPFLIYSSIAPIRNIGDGYSVWIIIQETIKQGNFNFWNEYNTLYNSPFFSFTYNDIVIKGIGEIYPLQFTGTMLIYIIAAQIGGQSFFYLVSPAFGALSLLGIYLLSREMITDRLKALVPSIVLAVSPLFVVWSIFPGSTMLSTTFFIYMILYLIRVLKKFTLLNTFAFIICLDLMVLTRYPHILLAAAPMLLFLCIPLSKKLQSLSQISIKNSLLILLIVPLSLIGTLLFLNFVWFGDPFFVAYFMKNNVPFLSEGLSTGAETYLGSFLSLEAMANIMNYAVLFFGQSNFVLPLFIISWVGIGLVLKRRNKEENKFWILLSVMFLVSLLGLLIFYGASSNVFWSGNVSIALPHFRYLFPLYSLLPIFSIPILDFIYSHLNPLISISKKRILLSKEKRKLLTIVTVSIVLILPSFYCFNYSEVRWIDDVDDLMAGYHNSASLPPSGSVIMYGDRWPLLLLLPQNFNYIWFYYVGIPEAYRINETHNTLEQMLNNNETVLFFSSRYDSIEISEMRIWLQTTYSLNILNDTYYSKLDLAFYQVTRY